MKIHAYTVATSGNADLNELLSDLANRSLEDRMLDYEAHSIRLEHVELRNDRWFLDFAKIRYQHGPGRAPRARPISGFRLEPDEGFGEETAAMFDPETECFINQYNHHGPRIGAIESYLNSFLSEPPLDDDDPEDELQSLEFAAVLRQDAFAELRQKELIRKIELAVSLPGLTSADRNVGVALGALASAPLPGGTQSIEVKLAAARSPSAGLSFDRAISEIRRALRLEEGVTKVKVHAKDNLEARTQVLDLLNARLELDLSIEARGDRRFAVEDRWRRLRTAYRTWHRSDSLPISD